MVLAPAIYLGTLEPLSSYFQCACICLFLFRREYGLHVCAKYQVRPHFSTRGTCLDANQNAGSTGRTTETHAICYRSSPRYLLRNPDAMASRMVESCIRKHAPPISTTLGRPDRTAAFTVHNLHQAVVVNWRRHQWARCSAGSSKKFVPVAGTFEQLAADLNPCHSAPGGPAGSAALDIWSQRHQHLRGLAINSIFGPSESQISS